MSDLPQDVRPPGLVLDARLHLLDRQILDADGTPVCTVDDLEVHGLDGSDLPDGTQPAVVTSLLSGAVLATRIFGGRPPPSRWHRIRWTHVRDVGTTVTLGTRGDELDVTWQERWIRDHVIRRIPGGSNDPG
jgi:hypothetical protein